MIFLSASIPVQERHRKYIDTADVIAIRDAVRALATVVIPKSHLVWGGHPAITPLIHYVMRKMNADLKEHITLYQSEWFKDTFPKDNLFFENVVITDKKETLGSSLELMRNSMIKNHPYKAGIFIGGMDGIEEEFNLFRQTHPSALLLPVASTGAAAKIIHDKYLVNPDPRLLNDYAYMTLFKSLLKDQINF
ncbi:MAG: hypothetical protein IPM74_03710 [Crocinitomicaceae bacterium]|nr:hypothetical protein [Crocinitomicaceae bacterium]MBK8925020.1 hypothetical protein [Crocinitomicaceae bacterium]